MRVPWKRKKKNCRIERKAASNIYNNSPPEGFSYFKFTRDVFVQGSAYLIDIG